ncbi:MAG: NADH-quinone oxidoreductase subunit NuoG [Acidimicrobiales bacterium]
MTKAEVETEAGSVTITVDGKAIKAKPGEMIIAAAERGGVYIPRFCWHPRMKPVGMCRMCLVDVKGPRGMALQPSCYVPVTDGMEVVTDSPKVKKAQDGVLEFLLINHPLDCPVCDRGGECPLQDQTFAFGPGESRFVEEKRHWAKPIPINPLVALDRERCIQCARCTRFAEEVAGDAMIDFVGRADLTEVGIFYDQPFDSNFSGNIVQICPVGALTSTPYRFRARPWDLDVVESTCTACSVGCRIAVQSSSNRLIRHLGIDSEPVNHGWLCDKGRFFYEAANSPDRLTHPLVRKGDELIEASWSEALGAAADGLRRVRDDNGSEALAVLGGARLPNEDAYVWAKVARAVLGTDNVDCQMGDGLPPEVVLGLPRATIDEACRARAVLIIGPDLKEELPILYLRLREAAIDGDTRLVEVVPLPTGMSRQAAATLLYRPGEVAKVIRSLVERPDSDPRLTSAADVLGTEGEGMVVVLGRPSLAESTDSLVEAAGILLDAFPGVRFLTALRRGNVHGALDMGLSPGILPGRVSLDDGREWYQQGWSSLPAARGLDALGILSAADASRVRGLILVGADPMSDFPDRSLARRALAGAGFTVAVDCFRNPSHAHADVILPAATFAERAGTTTNLEGRVTRLNQKVTPPGTARPDWMIATELALRLGHDLGFDSLDAVAAEIERLAPSHAGVTPDVLARPAGRDGIVVPLAPEPVEPEEPSNPATESIEVRATEAHMGSVIPESEPAGTGAPLEPEPGPPYLAEPDRAGRPALLRFSAPTDIRSAPPVDAYSLRLASGRRLFDAGVMVQQSPSLAQLAGAASLRVNPYDLDQLGIRGGQRVRVTSPRGSLVVETAPDHAVPRGSASLDFNQVGEGAADLIDASQPVTEVRLESVGAGS